MQPPQPPTQPPRPTRPSGSAHPPVASPPAVAIASIPYWRKSMWNGFTCVPIFMVLERGQLSAFDRYMQRIFTTPAVDAEVSVSRLGTMTLRVGRCKYTLVGRGAKISPNPSSAQEAALKQFWQTHGEPAIDVPRHGIFDTFFNGMGMWHTRTWMAAFRAVGARVSP